MQYYPCIFHGLCLAKCELGLYYYFIILLNCCKVFKWFISGVSYDTKYKNMHTWNFFQSVSASLQTSDFKLCMDLVSKHCFQKTLLNHIALGGNAKTDCSTSRTNHQNGRVILEDSVSIWYQVNKYRVPIMVFSSINAAEKWFGDMCEWEFITWNPMWITAGVIHYYLHNGAKVHASLPHCQNKQLLRQCLFVWFLPFFVYGMLEPCVVV